jgi:hypothetical protein
MDITGKTKVSNSTQSMTLKDWFLERTNYYTMMHVRKLVTTSGSLIGLTIALLIVLAFYDIFNVIAFEFLQLGTVLAVVLLVFILISVLRIVVNLGFIIRGATNGAKLICCIVVLVLVFQVGQAHDTLIVVGSDNLDSAVEHIADSELGKRIFGLPVNETGMADDVAITLVTHEVIDSYKYATKSGVETVTPPEGAKFLVAYIKVENVGKVKTTLPRWSTPLDNEWIGPFTQNEISLHYEGTSLDPHWLCDTVESQGHSWDDVTKYPMSPPYKQVCTEDIYPGSSVEGWIAFVVPAGIELEQTTLKIRGVTWRLG